MADTPSDPLAALRQRARARPQLPRITAENSTEVLIVHLQYMGDQLNDVHNIAESTHDAVTRLARDQEHIHRRVKALEAIADESTDELPAVQVPKEPGKFDWIIEKAADAVIAALVAAIMVLLLKSEAKDAVSSVQGPPSPKSGRP